MSTDAYYPAAGPAWMKLVTLAFVVVVALGVGVGTWVLWAPTDVEIHVEAQDLVVRTKLGLWGSPKRVALDSISEVRAVELRGGWRVRGTGRPDFCEGIFHYPDIGDVWQGTRCGRHVVLIRAGDGARPMLLQPEDPQAFVSAVHSKSPGAFPTATARAELPITWIVVRWSVLAIFPVLLLMFFHRNITYIVEGQSLRVHGPFGWSTFELPGRRAYRHTPKRLWRTFGAGMPGYWVGRFRGDGAPLRVWATRRSDGVVLDGKPRVWVTPEDPDAFLEALRQGGATIGRADPATEP